MVPGTMTVTELCCFLGFCFSLFFFLMECAGCLYNFVQMTPEPGKADAHLGTNTAIIGLLTYLYKYKYIYIYNLNFGKF
jgi:type III secretory pathway component EscT